MITYAEHIKNEVSLLAATKSSKDKIKMRFIELDSLAEKDKIQQAEYATLENAMRLRFRSEQADQKAERLLGKAESESRKQDAHAKILIGLAAIKLAQSDVELNKNLVSYACAMTSAPAKTIRSLLDCNN